MPLMARCVRRAITVNQQMGLSLVEVIVRHDSFQDAMRHSEKVEGRCKNLARI